MSSNSYHSTHITQLISLNSYQPRHCTGGCFNMDVTANHFTQLISTLMHSLHMWVLQCGCCSQPFHSTHINYYALTAHVGASIWVLQPAISLNSYQPCTAQVGASIWVLQPARCRSSPGPTVAAGVMRIPLQATFTSLCRASTLLGHTHATQVSSTKLLYSIDFYKFPRLKHFAQSVP
jgi:hypothetical protein